MPSLRDIRRQIRSVQNTAKVTNAMQMVAGSKMRRAQDMTLAGRPYAEKIREVLAHLASQNPEEQLHPLLQKRDVRRILIIHITPDKGLCGGLPGNLNRLTGQFILEQESPVTLITVGKKGRDFMVRYGRDVTAVFTDIGDRPTFTDSLPISQMAIQNYSSGNVDKVFVAYGHFVNTIVQQPTLLQLLPMEPPEEIEAAYRIGYIYEPSNFQVLETLLPRYVQMQVYHSILEAIASEQSARMVAMRNATDAATEMVESLTLELNKARQETITKELLDIVGGVVALES